MKAIDRLRKSGLTTTQVAAGIGCTEHMVRLYERGKRFPSKKNFVCMVELAESRGLMLVARDFISDGDVCEADSGNKSLG
jgi:transcriptional regulator with XRE-family HTH domain